MATFLGGILEQAERGEAAEKESARAPSLGEALRKLTEALQRQLEPGGGGRLRPRREHEMATYEDLFVRDFFSRSRRVEAAATANKSKVTKAHVDVLRRAVDIYNGPEKLSWTQVAARLLEETSGDERSVAVDIYGGQDQRQTGDPGDRLRRRVERARRTGRLPPLKHRR